MDERDPEKWTEPMWDVAMSIDERCRVRTRLDFDPKSLPAGKDRDALIQVADGRVAAAMSIHADAQE